MDAGTHVSTHFLDFLAAFLDFAREAFRFLAPSVFSSRACCIAAYFFCALALDFLLEPFAVLLSGTGALTRQYGMFRRGIFLHA